MRMTRLHGPTWLDHLPHLHPPPLQTALKAMYWSLVSAEHSNAFVRSAHCHWLHALYEWWCRSRHCSGPACSAIQLMYDYQEIEDSPLDIDDALALYDLQFFKASAGCMWLVV